MKPKEKAKELVDNFYQLAENIEWTTDNETKEKSGKFNEELGNDVLIYWNELAKQSALIAVDEIYKLKLIIGQHLEDIENKENYYSYWEEVKQEIQLL
jgi:hypothetical protein